MTVPPIAPFDGVIEPDMLPSLRETDSLTSKFTGWFAGELSAVNDKLVTADHDVQKLAVGSAGNLHEVMIHMEEARLSFQLLAQVRNKLLEAYQEVMRTPV
jgi:flagellar hook-basal body complex protein FliE